jgi:rhodanese-related sulfurtransferase
MNWVPLVVAVGIFVVYLAARKAGLISIKAAKDYLKSGALVIDVRSAGEFVAGHLPSAVNLPLNEIETSWTRRVKDKNRVLLLHCQSGARSKVARKKLIALGCPNTFNMGSYDRAARIVSGK